ncbi:MAG TPA: hypothetical protein VEH31_06425 [Streptosporangiaceae bacterium]|nr:hypothetical protein [Streptosporangiaceae bacterium]
MPVRPRRFGQHRTRRVCSAASNIAGSRAAGQPALTAWGCHSLGQVQRAQGRLDAALGTHQQTLEITATTGQSALPAAGVAHVGMAEAAYQRDDLEAALRHVSEGIALCRQLFYPLPLAAGLATLAWIRQAQATRPGPWKRSSPRRCRDWSSS